MREVADEVTCQQAFTFGGDISMVSRRPFREKVAQLQRDYFGMAPQRRD